MSLEKIHEQITEKGWKKGTYGDISDKTDSFCGCMNGWVLRNYRGDPLSLKCMNVKLRIKQSIRKLYPEGEFNDNIVNWNDSPNRTFEEVLAVLKEADV